MTGIEFNFGTAPRFLDVPLPVGTMIRMLQTHRRIVDAGLYRAAYWNGHFRRQLVGRGEVNEISKAENAFNTLVNDANEGKLERLDINTIRYLHDLTAGGTSYRKTTMRVGNNLTFPPPHMLEELMDKLFIEIDFSKDDPILNAIKVQLVFLSIHPFCDGNGRTSRLMTAHILLKEGFRSTLFTAVDQHFRNDMDLYLRTIREFQHDRIDIDEAIANLIMAMLNNVAYVSWFRTRKQVMCKILNNLEIQESQQLDTISDYDFGKPNSRVKSTMKKNEIPPLHKVIRMMSTLEKEALHFQIKRLMHEELYQS